MASLQPHHHTAPEFYTRFISPPRRIYSFVSHRWGHPASFRSTSRAFKLQRRGFGYRGVTNETRSIGLLCGAKEGGGVEQEKGEEEERPPFDINLAVVLAGFAFEAYRNPPENVGRSEIDAAGCKTVYLSESFVQEIYDGQLFIKLKKGFEFPAMDPWGTSDPYVVMQLEGQFVKSQTKWGTKDPSWNEEFMFHIKQPAKQKLQVAAWDANLVTPPKRMGNAGINLEDLCDGNLHEVLVKLEGMGGGGKLQIEVKYKSFEQIDEEKKWWRLPFVTEILQKSGFESALKMAVGSESVPARQFVEYAFGQFKSFNDASPWMNSSTGKVLGDSKHSAKSDISEVGHNQEVKLNDHIHDPKCPALPVGISGESQNADIGEAVPPAGGSMQSDKLYWRDVADIINQMVVHKLGIPASLELKWEGFDLLNSIGLQSQKIAEEGYIESGLATAKDEDVKSTDEGNNKPESSALQTSFPDITTATKDLLRQTDSVFGALMVLTSAISKLNKESPQEKVSESQKLISSLNESPMDDKKAEEMRALFSTAESAMEAWAMLATSLGHPSFIRSEFEKICFLDNESTDSQVAIWRDSARRRLVVAFRGTEQTRWKDLITDLMLMPAGMNPERTDGDFKEEVQVHSGFLGAYDSVRIRIMSIIKLSIGFMDDATEVPFQWHVYVTGHSLGGALATLLALELSSSQLSKWGIISVTMYNFGSPRVGNNHFAEVYNQKVKDSWRVVNHRDIIPTVPRLMGYCHVDQPVYLGARELQDTLENLEVLKDGYQGDVIGEYTPDVLVNEVMKGEKELIDKILNTEINIFRAIRDGSALMQHMEDFYYITLLEHVRSRYQAAQREVQGTKPIG